MCALDRAIRNQLHTQHGIATHAQLLNAGFSPDKIHRWVKAGHLIPLHRGVYAVGHLPPSPHAKAMAALLACGPTAVLSHRSAAKLWGLIRYDGPIEVTTPARTLRDLTGTLPPATLTRAVNDARLNNLISLDDLPPSQQTPRPTRSALEDTFLTFVARHNLPAPEINTTVAGYEVDVLAFETSSPSSSPRRRSARRSRAAGRRRP